MACFSPATPRGTCVPILADSSKSRLVPLHASVWAALDHYLERRQRVAGSDPHLFISRCYGRLSHTVVAETKPMAGGAGVADRHDGSR